MAVPIQATPQTKAVEHAVASAGQKSVFAGMKSRVVEKIRQTLIPHQAGCSCDACSGKAKTDATKSLFSSIGQEMKTNLDMYGPHETGCSCDACSGKNKEKAVLDLFQSISTERITLPPAVLSTQEANVVPQDSSFLRPKDAFVISPTAPIIALPAQVQQPASQQLKLDSRIAETTVFDSYESRDRRTDYSNHTPAKNIEYSGSHSSKNSKSSKRYVIGRYTYEDILASAWLRKMYGHLVGLSPAENEPSWQRESGLGADREERREAGKSCKDDGWKRDDGKKDGGSQHNGKGSKQAEEKPVGGRQEDGKKDEGGFKSGNGKRKETKQRKGAEEKKIEDTMYKQLSTSEEKPEKIGADLENAEARSSAKTLRHQRPRKNKLRKSLRIDFAAFTRKRLRVMAHRRLVRLRQALLRKKILLLLAMKKGKKISKKEFRKLIQLLFRIDALLE
ncbi:hypothetical protein FJZ26_04495 [Candidatus Parvarchaeota archaeon]|nr:hypothetical protein [Candidatus Parvarchaeota archaeon]